MAPTNQDEMKFPQVFCQVESSSLVDEFHRQSMGTSEGLPIIRYAFLTSIAFHVEGLREDDLPPLVRRQSAGPGP